MTNLLQEEAFDAIMSGSGDIAAALNSAAQLISGVGSSRRGTVVLSIDTSEARSAITGVLSSVLAADTADYLVVISAASAVVVDLDAEGVTRAPFEDLGSIGSAKLKLAQAPVRVCATSAERAEYHLRMAMAAALIQNARAAYQLARHHVREREQFGAPLVKIPGVAANLARVHVEIQRLDAAFARGARAGASLTDAVVVSAVTSDAVSRVARLAHQLSGALGIREDYPLQQHTRRIWAGRDFPRGEYLDTQQVGRSARLGGESVVWDVLTAAG